ncbi:MAG: hypothetical protein NXI19_04680 [Alphaproteobacteria bacterium]|nr:hypothetical protein [Alphaproteobacteria bacterium]
MVNSTPHINGGVRFDNASDITWSVFDNHPASAAVVAQSLNNWSSISNVTFRQIGANDFGADLLFTTVADISPGSVGAAGIAQLFITGTSVDYAFVGLSPTALSPSATLTHEIGHAVFDLVDNPGNSDPSIQGQFSIMNYARGTLVVPGSSDIKAAQALYGRSDASDLVTLTDTNDVLYAAGGQDTVWGGAGADLVYGNLGSDVIYGNTGNDTIFGGQNDGVPSGDPLAMRDGVEFIWGGSGDDVLYGNHGADVLQGNADNDVLYGGQDSDTLSGGAGSDTIFGNKGDDHMWGGSGADIFSTAGGGNDVVHDFNAAEGDRIDVSNPATVTIGNNGGLAMFQHETGSITLVGVAPDQASAGWLI